MFTGIVQAVGRVVDAAPAHDGLRIAVDAGELDARDVAIGDSVAVSGCCLTVVERHGRALTFDVSAATLACTTGFDAGRAVNLELSLKVGDRLGGHFVAGHVDGVARVVTATPVADIGGSVALEIEVPSPLARFIAHKGSIAIDGVSLTVNEVRERRFTVNLIPHTLAATTLSALAPDSSVNIEVDVIARYVARLDESVDEPRRAR